MAAVVLDSLETEHFAHVRNAPSPGATSALAIAEHIVSMSLHASPTHEVYAVC
ncbi:hypothetical protein G4Z16_01645 [Streptomyces bathyalis]|uniref:Uncharacterized protein n=1 Tax=Streptomyces bathyalis TaxID=2710756 RepID=A0A7T1T262_9ACTN|nr:hypothetical protein [Streptomyces bathyalis]QPP05010.1 hypothetical protein G4Z16_01645 [Streptomyces bathyalis]